jgi:hypothetical protein
MGWATIFGRGPNSSQMYQSKKINKPLRAVCCPKAGMHNIRLAGQLWPAKAFNLARESPYFGSFFDKNTI